MSDHTLGIDAGFGLFASRPFRSDSTIKNDDIITYYEGTEMSLEEVDRVQNDPNYTRTTGFIILFQGMAIDGYDHDNDTYASPGVVINDFLDDRNNCYFSKDSSDSDSDGDDDYTYKRKSCTKGPARLHPRLRKRRLAIRCESHVNVDIHQEFGIPYGEFHFCKASVHIAVLFKAARYYWDDIMTKPERRDRWSRLPQARYLFNTPYHGAAPQTSQERMRIIIHHLIRCDHNRCSCDLDSYLQNHEMVGQALLTADPDNLNLTSENLTSARARRARESDTRVGSSMDSVPRKKIPTTRDSQTFSECLITKVVPRKSTVHGSIFTAPAKSRQGLSVPDSTNGRYDLSLDIRQDTSLPAAGLGLWINGLIREGDVVGIYENATNHTRMTTARITNPMHKSDYAITHAGLCRDALNQSTRLPCCKVAYANDALDSRKDNLLPDIHPTRPNLLLLRATRDIQDEWGYLPYGPSFWCDDKYPFPLLVKVVQRYQIDIHTSSADTDGNWKGLRSFKHLSALFPSDGQGLCFNDATSTWREIDHICSQDDRDVHHNGSNLLERIYLNTMEIQDLRGHWLGTTTIAAYLGVLCRSSDHLNVRYFDPIYTSLMVGLEINPEINVHTKVHDHHIMCDWLLCAIVHENHISMVTVDFLTISLFHDDSLHGYHSSTAVLNGMEQFLERHFQWRRLNHMPTRDGFPEHPVWRKVSAALSTCSKQYDNNSCGVFACWNATARVFGIPLLAFHQYHAPLMRLHIFHCFMANCIFIPFIDSVSDAIRQRMIDTMAWYVGHNAAHTEYRTRRLNRPLPPERSYLGRGTKDDPLQLDDNASANGDSLPTPSSEGINAKGGTVRHSIDHVEEIKSQDFNEMASQEHRQIGVMPSVSTRTPTQKRRIRRHNLSVGTPDERHLRKRPSNSILEPKAVQINQNIPAPTFSETILPTARRPAFRAGDRSKGYAEKCRRARLAQNISNTDPRLSLPVSQNTEASPTESNARDTMDLPSTSSDYLLCPQPVPEVPGTSVSTELSRKRGRDLHEMLHSNSESPQKHKRKFTRTRNIGYARQKTTMDSFVSRLKEIPRTSMEMAGGSAALGVVSNTSLVIHNVNDSVMPVEHVELIGQIEHDYSCEGTPTKRARTAQTAAHSPALSTLEYDKRIADS